MDGKDIWKSTILTSVKVQFRHLHCVSFAVLLTETEYNDRCKVSFHDHLNNVEYVGCVGAAWAAASAALVTLGRVTSVA